MEENKFYILDKLGNPKEAIIHSIVEIVDSKFCICSVKNANGNYDILASKMINTNGIDNLVPITDENEKTIIYNMIKELTDIAKKHERR